MTYSNRSVSTPYQHRSEFDKSSNAVSCRKLNPFVNNPPGAWSAPYKYANPSPPPQNNTKFPTDPSPSPICNWGATYGDNTVSVCDPPFKFDPVLSCPMSRPLVPERRIDPGMWAYNQQAVQKVQKFLTKEMLINIVVGILIVILILKFRSSKK